MSNMNSLSDSPTPIDRSFSAPSSSGNVDRPLPGSVSYSQSGQPSSDRHRILRRGATGGNLGCGSDYAATFSDFAVLMASPPSRPNTSDSRAHSGVARLVAGTGCSSSGAGAFLDGEVDHRSDSDTAHHMQAVSFGQPPPAPSAKAPEKDTIAELIAPTPKGASPTGSH